VAADPPGRLDPRAAPGEIDQRDVGRQPGAGAGRRRAGGQADHLDAGEAVHDPGERLPGEPALADDEDAQHHGLDPRGGDPRRPPCFTAASSPVGAGPAGTNGRSGPGPPGCQTAPREHADALGASVGPRRAP
jgi:hypothetical protein